MKRMAVDYKGGCCMGCGYNACVQALQFHHLEPNHKDFSISADGHTRSWERTRTELDKCLLVCANCHMEIHAGVRQVPQAEAVAPPVGVYVDEQGEERFAAPNVLKHRGKALLVGHCVTCDCTIDRHSTWCRKCARALRAPKIEWPPVPALLEMLAASSFSAVGRHLGVSDNAIRKHLRTHEPAR